MNYTKGEWKARTLSPDKHGIITREAWEIFTPEYDVVAQIIGSAPIRNEADACLIAAAPDMYEALKQVKASAEYHGVRVWDYVEKALAKAEGK